MLSHDQMMQHGGYQSGFRGLHYHCGQGMRDAANTAARAVFVACDGTSSGWKSWVHRSARMRKISQALMASFLGANPNATPQDLYLHISYFPCDGEKIPFSCGNIWKDEPLPWCELPPAVRAAYEAFHHVYLQLWLIARLHHQTVAQAIPPRPTPRLVHDAGNVVHLDTSDGGAA